VGAVYTQNAAKQVEELAAEELLDTATELNAAKTLKDRVEAEVAATTREAKRLVVYD
jgi:uncharacterized protein YunC (DUF1805 family)